jgi:hypothetical protein
MFQQFQLLLRCPSLPRLDDFLAVVEGAFALDD